MEVLQEGEYLRDEDGGNPDEEKFMIVIAMEMTCEDLVSATDARVTTLLALLLTVVATGSLYAAVKAKRFEQCCGLLAVGGFAGLVGAVN